MTLDEMQGWMLKLAEIFDDDSTHNQVFVMRQVLTEAYRRGFDDGQHAADRDSFVLRQIDRGEVG